MLNRINSERKVKRKFGTFKFEYFEVPLGDVLRTSYGRLESTSQGHPLKVRIGRPLDVISEYLRDIRSGRPWDGQIGSLWDVLGTLEGNVLGTSLGPIFAGWAGEGTIRAGKDFQCRLFF